MELLKKYFMHRRGGFVYPPVNRRYVLQNFNLIACRTLQNAISAPRHQIMVTVNEMDRMDCPYRHSALGRIIEMPIELLSQSAALFCPYNSIEYFFNSLTFER